VRGTCVGHYTIVVISPKNKAETDQVQEIDLDPIRLSLTVSQEGQDLFTCGITLASDY